MTLHSFKDRSEFGLYLTSAGYSGTGVEIGVFKGDFSHQILSQWNGKLIGVDIYNNGTEMEILAEALAKNNQFVREGRYRILVCDQLKAVPLVPSELDFVYLDAEHSQKAVTDGIKHWYPKLRVGGLMCGHDMQVATGGVGEAVLDFVSSDPRLRLHHKPCGSWFVEKKQD